MRLVVRRSGILRLFTDSTVAIDGVVYTDDTPFWLGLARLDCKMEIVYRSEFPFSIG